MKNVFIILVSVFLLQGCLTAVAGFNDGGAKNNIFNRNKSELSEEEKLRYAQNKELRACLEGSYQVDCVKDMFLKKCEVSLFKEAELFLTCNADSGAEVFSFYIKGMDNDGKQFEKVLNTFPSKRQ